MKKEQEIVWYEIQRIYQTMKKEQEIVSEEAISIFNMWELVLLPQKHFHALSS